MLIVVAGTGTEVGKTWAGARLASTLRDRGLSVQARKPAQSFEPDDPLEGTDAAQLGAATGAPAHLQSAALALVVVTVVLAAAAAARRALSTAGQARPAALV